MLARRAGSRFFESSARALEKLQDLKRTEYKNRNAQIEVEEQVCADPTLPLALAL